MSSTAPVVFHIAGYETCGYYVKARAALMGVEVLFPSLVKIGGIHNCESYTFFPSLCPLSNLTHLLLRVEQSRPGTSTRSG